MFYSSANSDSHEKFEFSELQQKWKWEASRQLHSFSLVLAEPPSRRSLVGGKTLAVDDDDFLYVIWAAECECQC
ncbi:hypothetical protein TNCV_1627091 [Trichonephila clavipes]|nr:hypothetical protein TNCV_1627091 [Trichonephila clavipes]